jgi:hypothetical protein
MGHATFTWSSDHAFSNVPHFSLQIEEDVIFVQGGMNLIIGEILLDRVWFDLLIEW